MLEALTPNSSDLARFEYVTSPRSNQAELPARSVQTLAIQPPVHDSASARTRPCAFSSAASAAARIVSDSSSYRVVIARRIEKLPTDYTGCVAHSVHASTLSSSGRVASRDPGGQTTGWASMRVICWPLSRLHDP